jgi:hypothetical protein
MSRLAARIGRLERSLGPCAVCADWKTSIELRHGTSADAEAAGEAETRTCPACGRIDETITVWLAYEPPPRDEEANTEERRS